MFLRVLVAVHKTADFPQLQFITVVDTPFVAQKQILMVQTIQPFLGITVAVRLLIVDVSVVLVVQILTCSCGEDSLVPQCSSLRKSSPAENCNTSAVAVLHGRPHPCRDAEPDPHGLVDHGDSAVAGGHGDLRPCCAGAASSTGAVEKSVVLPQLHLMRNSLRAAHELPGRLFRALHTGAGPGVVSTGTRPP